MCPFKGGNSIVLLMMTSFLLVKGLRIAMMYQGVNVEGLEAYCGIRDSSGSHPYGSKNGSEDFTSICYASNKKHISSRIFSYTPRDKEKIFLGR
jgi:hypothetical protein